MNIKEAIQTAIKYETKVRDAYRTAMNRDIDDRTRKLLLIIAKEEHGHLDYLRKAYDHLQKNGKLEKFESDLESAWYEAEESLLLIGETLKNEKVENSANVLETILAVESLTYNFYQKISRELPDKQRSFFERFVISEKRHMEKLQSLLENVTGKVSYLPS